MSVTREITDEKRHGQYYTPAGLANFLAGRAFAHTSHDASPLMIVDPACGDGELLIAAAAAARRMGHSGPMRLIGYEIDEAAAHAASRRLEAAGLDSEIMLGDFLVAQRTMPSNSVDLIITNPPYVRTQHLGQETAQLMAGEFGLRGRVDLTHPFVAVAPRLLKADGTLALLCSNRFLTTLAGENVRRALLFDELRVRELYDLGDTKIFKAAVLPAIIIADKAKPSGEPTKYVSAYETQTVPGTGNDTLPLLDALNGSDSSHALHNGKHYAVKVGVFIPPVDTKTPWRLSEPTADDWLTSIERNTWKTFGEIAKIRVGIKTTADKVFLSDGWDHVSPAIEPELLLPLITQSNVTPWRISENLSMRVLYPYDLTSQKRIPLDIDEWPGVKNYLLRHEDQLSGRRYVIDGGREWWEIWVPQRPALWAEPKIVFPDISESPRFALDTTGAVVNGNCYWISLADIEDEDIAYLMLAVANSALGLRYYDEVCGNRLYSGKRRWITQYVNRLPLPNPHTPEAQQLIADAHALTTAGDVNSDVIAKLNRDVETAFAASHAFEDGPLRAGEASEMLF